MRSKVHINTIEFVLCLPNVLAHGACLSMQIIYQVRLHWRKLIFLGQQVSTEASVLVISGHCVHFPLQFWTSSGMHLQRFVWDSSLCESICTSVLLCFSDSVSLESCINSGSYNQSLSFIFNRALRLNEKYLINTSDLRLSAPRSPTLCTLSPCGFLC